MVFELAGRLRYHALWAYAALVGVFVGLDKVSIQDTQALVLLLAPVAMILTADVIKNRNRVS